VEGYGLEQPKRDLTVLCLFPVAKAGEENDRRESHFFATRLHTSLGAFQKQSAAVKQ